MPMAQPFPLPYSRTVVRSLFGPLLPLPIPSGPEPYPSAYCLVGSCMVQALPLLELTGTGTLPARHPTPRRGAPPPPSSTTARIFWVFVIVGVGCKFCCFDAIFVAFECFWGFASVLCGVLLFGPVFVVWRVLGPPASLRSLGYRPHFVRLLPVGVSRSVVLSFASAFRFTPGRASFPPLGGPTPYQVPDLSMSTRFIQLQHHPMTDSRNRFPVIVHLEAWVLKPFQVTFPSLPADRAYCGPFLRIMSSRHERSDIVAGSKPQRILLL